MERRGSHCSVSGSERTKGTLCLRETGKGASRSTMPISHFKAHLPSKIDINFKNKAKQNTGRRIPNSHHFHTHKKKPKTTTTKKPKQLPLLYCSCCSFAHDQQPPGHASQAPYAFLQERATCPTSPRFAYVGWKWERVTCAKATLLSPACLVLLLPMTHRGHSWQSCMGGVWHSLIVYEHAVYLSISHKCLW